MIKLRFQPECEPRYMTEYSAGADVVARESVVIPPLSRVRVPTGVWITDVDWQLVPAGQIPELQVRCRSGLAFKKGIMLTNGVGTIDADYRDEIAVLLFNSDRDFTHTIEQGERIAQLVLNLTCRLPGIAVSGGRVGGFGSTDQTARKKY